jgi:hypothetical protein
MQQPLKPRGLGHTNLHLHRRSKLRAPSGLWVCGVVILYVENASNHHDKCLSCISDDREDVGASVKAVKSDVSRSPHVAMLNRRRSESTSSESTASITDDDSSSSDRREDTESEDHSAPKSGRLRNRFSWVIRPFRYA